MRIRRCVARFTRVSSDTTSSDRERNSRLPGDIIYIVRLDCCPASLLYVGSCLGEIVRAELASPIGFNSLFNLTIRTLGTDIVVTQGC